MNSTDHQLALLGGNPLIPGPLPDYLSVGSDEREAVQRVLDRNSLSGFYGNWGDEFFGGEEVRAFEEEWVRKFDIPYAISVNSATSGLYAAMGAIGLSPGDEVIVPPFTMSASVIAPLIYGGIPVFVDIEPDTFCLDLEKVEASITPRTKAIMAVNLFGHPAQLSELSRLARSKGLYLVEDNAQAPLASELGKYAGTIGDIGVFSLNYHKHIHTGEGGVCVTRDAELALRLQAIRNHGENVVDPASIKDPINMVGFNYRMTEMSAAIGRCQLSNIESHVSRREELANSLSSGLDDLEGLEVPSVRPGCRHVYYLWALRMDEKVLGVSRRQFSAALRAEGFPHFLGYVEPLYLLPIFQKRIAMGRDGWPFSLTDRTYLRGMCPVAENMFESELLCFEPCAYRVDNDLAQMLVNVVRKVYANRSQIKKF